MSWNDNMGDPWGRSGRPQGQGGGPELEEWLRRLQERLRRRIPTSGPGTILLGLLALVAVLWLASGLYRVQPDEEGVVLRFGAYDRSTLPGLHYHAPWPIESVLTPKVTIINRIDIGFRAPLDERSAAAFRVSRDVAEESLMLTGDENIVDVDFSVFWVISNARDYLFNIQNPNRTVKYVAESAMREIVGKNDIQPILTEERQQIERSVKDVMQATLDAYGAGVSVREVKMQKVDPPGAVIDAFRDVQAARADQARVQNEAMAYSNKVVPEARGEAERLRREAEAYSERVIAESEGEARRFLSVYNEYNQARDVTRKRLFLETMEEIFKKANKVIIDSKNTSGVLPYLPLRDLTKGSDKSGGQGR